MTELCLPEVSPPPAFEIVGALGPLVFRALHLESGEFVHLKQVRSRRGALREARALARAASPFVPALRFCERRNDCYWLACEWIEGISPGARRMPPALWLPGFFRALSHLHRQGVVHGDLKPDNLLVDPHSGRVVLVDLGFASRLGEQSALHEAGGTAGFVAPERLTEWPADARSDLYSAGRLLQAVGAVPASLEALVTELVSDRPADRPERSDLVLARVVDELGPGWLPLARLALLGWRQGRTSAEHLGLGLVRFLGCPTHLAYRVARALLDSSGGQVLFAEPVWQAWLAEISADPWCPMRSERIESGLQRLPALGRELAATWFGRLPAELRYSAGRLALLGCNPRPRGLDSHPAGAPERVAELLDAGVLLPRSGGRSWAFASAPLWGAALGALDSEECRREHQARAAEVRPWTGRDRGPVPPGAREREALLAWHLNESGDFEEAGRHWFRAARLALKEGKHQQARRYSEQGMRLRAGGGRGEAHACLEANAAGELEAAPAPGPELLKGWSEGEVLERVETHSAALAMSGRIDEALAWNDLIPGLCSSPAALALYHANAARQLERVGRWTEVERHVEAGLALKPNLDEALEGRLRMHRAQALLGFRRDEEGAAEAQRAALNLARGQRILDQSTALQLAAVAALRQRKFGEALAGFKHALRISEERRAGFVRAAAYMNLSACEHARGEIATAQIHLRRALEIARTDDLKQIEWAALANLGVFARKAERWPESSKWWVEAADVAAKANRPGDLLQARAGLADALIRGGLLAQAERVFRAPEPADPGAGHEASYLRLRLREIELYVHHRRLPADCERLHEAISLAQDLKSRELHDQLRVLQAAHNLLCNESPRIALDELDEIPLDISTQGWFHLVRARALRPSERSRDAVEMALGCFEKLSPGRFERAYAWLEAGRLTTHATHRDEALGRCIELARDCGARWVEAQALSLRCRQDQRERA